MTPIPYDDQWMDLFQTPHVDAVAMTVVLELDGAKSIFGCDAGSERCTWVDNLHCIPPMHSTKLASFEHLCSDGPPN